MLFQKWWFIRSMLKYGSPCIAPLEKRSIHKLGKQAPEHPCIFILGPPRSGSTIFYQVLSSLLDISYVDNLANLARENPFMGSRLSQRFFGNSSHSSYSSDYGQTTASGLHAPAEALFFYKWFPDHHFTLASDLTDKQAREFRQTLFAMIRHANRALVIKNLSFSLRIQALKEILPDARYIVVLRDPLYTAQSLLEGMRKNKHPENKVWGIRPRNYKELEKLDPHEMVVQQVNQIERQIVKDLKSIPEENILYVEYEKFGTHLEAIINEVKKISGPSVKRRSAIPLPEIRTKNKITLPKEEIALLKKHIEALEWELH
jgi:Sulfotransferase family